MRSFTGTLADGTRVVVWLDLQKEFTIMKARHISIQGMVDGSASKPGSDRTLAIWLRKLTLK